MDVPRRSDADWPLTRPLLDADSTQPRFPQRWAFDDSPGVEQSSMARVCSLDVLPPVVAAGVVVATLVACLAIAKSDGRYLGGLDWPYFSDMGRDSPGYEVFCAGLSTVAAALVVTWWRNLQFQLRLVARQMQEVAGEAEEKAACTSARSVRSLSGAGASLAIASALGLPILAFFSTTSYPDVHQYAAYWFFVLEAIAVVINNVASYKLLKLMHSRRRVAGYDEAQSPSAPPRSLFDPWNVSSSSVRRTFLLQSVFATLFLLAFVLYIPVGLSIIKPFERLSINGCLERDLGVEYCSVTMKYDAQLTKLWNYEDDKAANQMRSASQLVCILTLVGYSLTFLSHDHEAMGS